MYQVRRIGHAIASLVIVFIVIAMGNLNASAQEPCATECDTATAPYVHRTVPVQAGPGCTILLTIRQRVCAGVYEVDVLSAVYGPGCDPTIDPRTALETALRSFVTGNGMEFPTGPAGSQNPPGSWVWRVTRPACWMVVTATKQLVPCTPYCCISYLQVTRNENCPDWKISGETQRNATRACPRVDGTSGGGDGGTVQPCASSCDALAPWLR
jgi:hypothetical protein